MNPDLIGDPAGWRQRRLLHDMLADPACSPAGQTA